MPHKAITIEQIWRAPPANYPLPCQVKHLLSFCLYLQAEKGTIFAPTSILWWTTLNLINCHFWGILCPLLSFDVSLWSRRRPWDGVDTFLYLPDIARHLFCSSFFIFTILFPTLRHLPRLRFYCVGGCWDRTLGQLRLRLWQSDALTTQEDINFHTDENVSPVWRIWITLIRIRIRLEPFEQSISGSKARFLLNKNRKIYS